MEPSSKKRKTTADLKLVRPKKVSSIVPSDEKRTLFRLLREECGRLRLPSPLWGASCVGEGALLLARWDDPPDYRVRMRVVVDTELRATALCGDDVGPSISISKMADIEKLLIKLERSRSDVLSMKDASDPMEGSSSRVEPPIDELHLPQSPVGTSGVACVEAVDDGQNPTSTIADASPFSVIDKPVVSDVQEVLESVAGKTCGTDHSGIDISELKVIDKPVVSNVQEVLESVAVSEDSDSHRSRLKAINEQLLVSNLAEEDSDVAEPPEDSGPSRLKAIDKQEKLLVPDFQKVLDSVNDETFGTETFDIFGLKASDELQKPTVPNVQKGLDAVEPFSPEEVSFDTLRLKTLNEQQEFSVPNLQDVLDSVADEMFVTKPSPFEISRPKVIDKHKLKETNVQPVFDSTGPEHSDPMEPYKQDVSEAAKSTSLENSVCEFKNNDKNNRHVLNGHDILNSSSDKTFGTKHCVFDISKLKVIDKHQKLVAPKAKDVLDSDFVKPSEHFGFDISRLKVINKRSDTQNVLKPVGHTVDEAPNREECARLVETPRDDDLYSFLQKISDGNFDDFFDDNSITELTDNVKTTSELDISLKSGDSTTFDLFSVLSRDPHFDQVFQDPLVRLSDPVHEGCVLDVDSDARIREATRRQPDGLRFFYGARNKRVKVSHNLENGRAKLF